MASIDAMKILGSLLSSGALSRGSGSNILGSLVGAMTGGGQAAGGRSQSGGGDLGSLIGGMLGGGQTRTGGGGSVGDLLGGLLGGGSQGAGGGLGDLLGMAMNQFGAANQGNAQRVRADAGNKMPGGIDYRQAEQQAELLIRAMINAAKSDGTVDREEQRNIIDRLGEVTQDEVEFVQRELAAPLDVQAFVRSIPRGMEQQVYTVSLMAIDLDSNPEAQYLHQLAQGTGISAEVCNQIHEQLGAPKLYS
jgi:uncharacterized membrane protein YebE (DUF533 family)